MRFGVTGEVQGHLAPSCAGKGDLLSQDCLATPRRADHHNDRAAQQPASEYGVEVRNPAFKPLRQFGPGESAPVSAWWILDSRSFVTGVCLRELTVA